MGCVWDSLLFDRNDVIVRDYVFPFGLVCMVLYDSDYGGGYCSADGYGGGA